MLKDAHKIIGYFSHTVSGDVFCDGDACIITGSKDLIKKYMKKMISNKAGKDIIKKTTFEEIMNGLKYGAAYALDKEAYKRFLPHARRNGINDLPAVRDFFSKEFLSELHFIKLQFGLGDN